MTKQRKPRMPDPSVLAHAVLQRIAGEPPSPKTSNATNRKKSASVPKAARSRKKGKAT